MQTNERNKHRICIRRRENSMIKVDRIDREMAKKRIQKKTDFQFDFQIINYVYPKKQKQKSVHIIN